MDLFADNKVGYDLFNFLFSYRATIDPKVNRYELFKRLGLFRIDRSITIHLAFDPVEVKAVFELIYTAKACAGSERNEHAGIFSDGPKPINFILSCYTALDKGNRIVI